MLARLALASSDGPFAHLPAPTDERESLSRKQAGPAIQLYQILRERHPADDPLEIVREVMIAGALIFLDHCLGSLTPSLFGELPIEERERLVERLASRFFNATVRLDEVGADRVRLTVTACRFASLAREAAVPELAPLFCAGDEAYFGRVQPDVELSRPHTIAEGAQSCPFELRRRG
ncbi:MAG: L-2-amino-thiazoline-4-carboxylic acid hydrolase [Deltaproteobacteria bacterium]|nr:L-2-amino-thiazoline-4-carboxylic acid hydrolase [Deltaproteobacteria bacterium]